MVPDRLLSVRCKCIRDVRFATQPGICPPRRAEVRFRETTRAGSLALQETPGQLQKLSEVSRHTFRMPRGSEWMLDLKQRRLFRSISDLFVSADAVVLQKKNISTKQSRDWIDAMLGDGNTGR